MSIHILDLGHTLIAYDRPPHEAEATSLGYATRIDPRSWRVRAEPFVAYADHVAGARRKLRALAARAMTVVKR